MSTSCSFHYSVIMCSEQLFVSYDFVTFLILKLPRCGESLCSCVSAKAPNSRQHPFK